MKDYLDIEQFRKVVRRIDNGKENRKKASVLIKFAFGNNFRIQNVRFAMPVHFKVDDGKPYYLVQHDKTAKGINPQWFAIPFPIYSEVMDLVKRYNIQPNEYIFWIRCDKAGANCEHEGVVTEEWLLKLWHNACKKEGFLQVTTTFHKTCRNCLHALPDKRCNVMGEDKVRARTTIKIRHCRKIDMIEEKTHYWPGLHKGVRKGGVMHKIKDLVDNKGYSPSQAYNTVYETSNWKSQKVFMQNYVDQDVRKELGNKEFLENYADLNLA